MRSFISTSLQVGLPSSILRGTAAILFILGLTACGGGGGGKSTPKPVSSATISSSGATSSSIPTSAASSNLISQASSSSSTANQMVGFVLPFDDDSAGITQRALCLTISLPG